MIGGRFFRRERENIQDPKEREQLLLWEIIESVADLKLSNKQRRRDFHLLLRLPPEIHEVRPQQRGEQSDASLVWPASLTEWRASPCEKAGGEKLKQTASAVSSPLSEKFYPKPFFVLANKILYLYKWDFKKKKKEKNERKRLLALAPFFAPCKTDNPGQDFFYHFKNNIVVLLLTRNSHRPHQSGI